MSSATMTEPIPTEAPDDPLADVQYDADGVPISGTPLDLIDAWMWSESRKNKAAGLPAGINDPRIRFDLQSAKALRERATRLVQSAEEVEQFARRAIPPQNRSKSWVYNAAVRKAQVAEYDVRQARLQLNKAEGLVKQLVFWLTVPRSPAPVETA
jgi:hypothetical protein